jgi:transcriptional regulator with XRE-family HTH domain
MSYPETGADPLHARVAEEVRAWLGRRNLSARQAAIRLGWSQTYLSRRITGDVPFDVGDLGRLASLLEIDPAAFFSEPADIRRRSVALVPLAA